MVWTGSHIHSWLHLHILRAHSGEMFAFIVSTSTSAIAHLSRHCGNGTIDWAEATSQMVTFRPIAGQCGPCTGDVWRLHRIQFICSHKCQTGRWTILSWHGGFESTMVPIDAIATTAALQYDQEFEKFGTTFRHRQFANGCQRHHLRLLHMYLRKNARIWNATGAWTISHCGRL